MDHTHILKPSKKNQLDSIHMWRENLGRLQFTHQQSVSPCATSVRHLSPPFQSVSISPPVPLQGLTESEKEGHIK